ncbi:MAG: hypothetical protein NC293_03325 [Roseburia sp.]|nr:hypothetical protein [Roseburia sp.]
MTDKKVKKLFEQELEIPEVVSDKMREAYQQIGADMEKADQIARGRHVGGHAAKRYLKAASIMLCFLVAATTVSAAAGGGFQKLSKLFGGDVQQIQHSTIKPEVSTAKNSFKNLKVSVEQVTGSEKLTYVLLKLKRTDGKTFDKDKKYSFKGVRMIGENDQERGVTDSGAETYILIQGGEDEGDEYDITTQSHFIDPGIMVENKGTDEIYLAVAYAYERTHDGKNYYHRGEKCTLLLGNLCQKGEDGEDHTIMKGEVETEFVLDYGKCPEKIVELNQKIQLPKCGSDTNYLSAGILKRVTITPYYIQYEREMSEKETEAPTWEQIYVEMEDGKMVGYPTEKDRFEADENDGMGGFGDGIRYGESKKMQMKDSLLFHELIDVEHVKAVWFGKTRIEVE